VPDGRGPPVSATVEGMQKLSLDAQAREHLSQARAAANGRSAQTVYGGHEHVLRQTVVALLSGTELAEHENPGEATVLVLSGRIKLTSGDTEWEGRTGDLIAVPPARHALLALEDTAVLLTVAKLG
jgi:quercetin dioxygenase-like cupin family protein